MNIIRRIVSGQRNRLMEGEFDLDLTYITPRIVAMSFPASEFYQKLYRNSIESVSKFLEEKHEANYFVYNMSGNKYDESPFNGQVLTADWEDHHSPTIQLLFQVCEHMHKFLKKKTENTAIVHCNAGKGRTGTLICCYLLYCGFADTAYNAITYYGWKRFKHGKGVTQPSQIRYVFYFEKVLREQVLAPRVLILDRIRVVSLPSIKQNFRI